MIIEIIIKKSIESKIHNFKLNKPIYLYIAMIIILNMINRLILAAPNKYLFFILSPSLVLNVLYIIFIYYYLANLSKKKEYLMYSYLSSNIFNKSILNISLEALAFDIMIPLYVVNSDL